MAPLCACIRAPTATRAASRQRRVSTSLLLLLLVATLVVGVSSSADVLRDATRLRRRLVAAQTTNETAACATAAASSPYAAYLTAIPETGGLRSCLANNLNSLLPALSGSTCSLTTIISLFSSTTDSDVSAFMEFFNALLAGLSTSSSGSASTTATTSASTFLSSWSTNSTKTQGFCNAMNSKIGPCVQALVPTLLSVLRSGPACCSSITEYVDVINLIVPTGKSVEQTLFDIVNGLHKTMCTTSGTSTLCGQTLINYLASATESSSLLSSIVFKAGLPLYVLPDTDTCAALDAKTIDSRVTSGTSVPYFAYSCCSAGLVSLLESVDASLAFLFGNTVPEMLNLITARQNATTATQFRSFYTEIKACSFSQTCTDPTFVLPSNAGTATVASSTAAAAKTAHPQNVACTKVEMCNADNVCSSVCSAGTAQIAPWAARAISYQRNQSYDKSICYTQLPATHNSATTLARGYGNRDQLINQVLNASNANSFMRTNNQFLSVVDQLRIGARFVEVDAHYYGGMIRSGHCSDVSISLIDDASAALVSELGTILGDTVTIEWQASLFGCLPSLSGIRAEEARPHSETIAEVADWITANPTELVIIYTEIGSELTAFSKIDALLQLYQSSFGDLIFTPADLTTAGGSWDAFTLSELIGKGKRVILVATPTANTLMFGMRSLCDGWSDSPGSVEYNSGRIVRAFSSALHYATLSEAALSGGSDDASRAVTTSTIPTLVNAGVNFIAPDGLDGQTMEAMVWSWASREPSIGDVAVQISATDGRWYGVPASTTIPNVACVSSSDRTSWRLVSQGSSCPSGFATGHPQLAIENAALVAVLKATGSDTVAQLNVDISAFPVITEADEQAFQNALASSSNSTSNPGTSGSSTPAPTTERASAANSCVNGSLWLSALLASWMMLVA
uniref:PLC-like phosphodiesterase n=1 Tax=Globisporangium ultimum (strain ATCC 200006 / CBS 805.95 / DAOM BR144) TaxID=431595 RepID=K3WNA0_GLOUD